MKDVELGNNTRLKYANKALNLVDDSDNISKKKSVEITEYDVFLIECLSKGFLQGQISMIIKRIAQDIGLKLSNRKSAKVARYLFTSPIIFSTDFIFCVKHLLLPFRISNLREEYTRSQSGSRIS